jgi:hypothetical protein
MPHTKTPNMEFVTERLYVDIRGVVVDHHCVSGAERSKDRMERKEQLMSNNELTAIRAVLAEHAGQTRRAEVETMAGWIDAEKWNPYGLQDRISGKKEVQCYVVFSFDRESMRVRETPAEYLRNLVPHDQTVSGLWPVRFIERTPTC